LLFCKPDISMNYGSGLIFELPCPVNTQGTLKKEPLRPKDEQFKSYGTVPISKRYFTMIPCQDKLLNNTAAPGQTKQRVPPWALAVVDLISFVYSAVQSASS